ncbi:hypothetical protein D3C87_79150 [compost metagenome]
MKIREDVYFYSEKGLHKGYVQRINKNTINIIVEDKNKNEGYQLWRVEEFFLEYTSEAAYEKWRDYKNRLSEMYKIIDARRKKYEFNKGLTVLVEPFNSFPYTGMVLKIGKATVDIVTEDGRFMKVDKSLCTPTYATIKF